MRFRVCAILFVGINSRFEKNNKFDPKRLDEKLYQL